MLVTTSERAETGVVAPQVDWPSAWASVRRFVAYAEERGETIPPEQIRELMLAAHREFVVVPHLLQLAQDMNESQNDALIPVPREG